MHIFTLEFTGIEGGKCRTEFHLLNPGDMFPGFGGSRAGLLVRKTASLITRERQNGMVIDTERDIHDPFFWKWFVTVMRDRPGCLLTRTDLDDNAKGE